MYCGIAKAEYLEAEAQQLRAWLDSGYNGMMDYMAETFDVRTDPRKLLPGANSVIVLLKNYYPHPGKRQDPTLPKISKYAYGEDYHRVMSHQITKLTAWLREEVPGSQTLIAVDSKPVMEKAWAVRTGAGWLGKNTNVLRPGAGSFFFIGVVLTTAALEPDSEQVKDYCGTCTACIDACPTDALKPYEIDATKCISYLTIELPNAMPETYRGKTAGWAFGCDICQDVCPWNRFSTPHNEPRFEILPHTQRKPEEWLSLTMGQFDRGKKHTPLRRLRYGKWLDNLDATSTKG